MKPVVVCVVSTVASLLIAGCGTQPSKPAPAFEKINPMKEELKLLPISDIKPSGWIKDQMKMDLDGFVGNLDSLVPDLVTRDDIYGKDRLTKNVKSKDVGAISDSGAWQVQFLWWNSETQSNWWDGYIRNAIMTDSPGHLRKAEAYVKRILSTQDVDGYLGIYDRDLRYKFDNENGELWAKATLLRGLIAWYEYSHEEPVLKAVRRAADNIMENYPAYASHPFHSVKPDVGGVTHGLAVTDVFEQLSKLTGNREYQDYCTFLYDDFSQQTLNEDAQFSKMLDTTLPMKGHGAHTYEHLRSVAAACYATGNPSLKTALKNFLKKIEGTTTPSGGPIGDEWIAGHQADATQTGYEYCSIHELMHGYIDLLAKSGDAAYGDKAERIFFNAAQGARNPRHSGISYLKTDNSFYMMGKRNEDSLPRTQTRYKYSPVHQDAAVCCVPNAGRITPYFVQGMWMQQDDGLTAALLGPSEVNTEWNGEKINVSELTEYPYNNKIRFVVTGKNMKGFRLRIRKPGWVQSAGSSRTYRWSGGYLVFDLDQPRTEIDIVFEASAREEKTMNGEHYFWKGALVYARPIGDTEQITKTHRVPRFFDYQYFPVDDSRFDYVEGKGPESLDDNRIKVILRNRMTGDQQEQMLVPMGKTILRQVTFK